MAVRAEYRLDNTPQSTASLTLTGDSRPRCLIFGQMVIGQGKVAARAKR